MNWNFFFVAKSQIASTRISQPYKRTCLWLERLFMCMVVSVVSVTDTQHVNTNVAPLVHIP